MYGICFAEYMAKLTNRSCSADMVPLSNHKLYQYAYQIIMRYHALWDSWRLNLDLLNLPKVPKYSIGSAAPISTVDR
jgi:hypothetical protein